MKKEKSFAAIISIASNSFLIILKIIAGVVSGSISIISEAIHSASDLLASFIALFSVSKSSEPADEDHHFGHGKYEDLSGFLEGALIIGAAIYIIYESMKKMLNPHSIDLNVNLGLIVMLVSVIVNWIVSTYLFAVAKKHDSMALYADAEHLRTDIWSSFAVFAGLLAVKFSGIVLLDPLVAIAVAFIIFGAGFKICNQSANNLLDKSLPEEESKKIEELLQTYIGEGVTAIKHIRTRKAGMKKNIEITLAVHPAMHISTGHKLCDEIERRIENTLGNTDITIHLEPN